VSVVDLPICSLDSDDAWRGWLDEHHASSPGVWLKIAKKSTGARTAGAAIGVSYPEALETALCFGWIDGQKKALDEAYWLQRFTPRGARSRWSRINRDKADGLIACGRMRPAGLAEVDRARADGRWAAAYAGQATATVPDDLLRELAGNAKAREFFDTLDSVNRYAILYRIQDAKKPETRVRRIAKFVAMLADQQKIHP
jgi:uncharacterized protein YdeI (YjbR/CyaY-like superfamily)